MILIALLLSLGALLLAILSLINDLRKRSKPKLTAPLPGAGISLMVPFRSDSGKRAETWEWLKSYWAYNLPGAQLVIGTDHQTPFCKTAAVNGAFSRATGDVVVILDADCYIDPAVIISCARQIRVARRAGQKLWFIPYRRFYRLTEDSSNLVLRSDPASPYRFPSPPSEPDLMTARGTSNGHHYGALIQIMPREAFEIVGGMDERFHGWGGEDVAFMRAVDTLFSNHKTSSNDVLHLWHPVIKGYDDDTRMWEGQNRPDGNWSLATRYRQAFGDRRAMRELVSES